MISASLSSGVSTRGAATAAWSDVPAAAPPAAAQPAAAQPDVRGELSTEAPPPAAAAGKGSLRRDPRLKGVLLALAEPARESDELPRAQPKAGAPSPWVDPPAEDDLPLDALPPDLPPAGSSPAGGAGAPAHGCAWLYGCTAAPPVHSRGCTWLHCEWLLCGAHARQVLPATRLSAGMRAGWADCKAPSDRGEVSDATELRRCGDPTDADPDADPTDADPTEPEDDASEASEARCREGESCASATKACIRACAGRGGAGRRRERG